MGDMSENMDNIDSSSDKPHKNIGGNVRAIRTLSIKKEDPQTSNLKELPKINKQETRPSEIFLQMSMNKKRSE